MKGRSGVRRDRNDAAASTKRATSSGYSHHHASGSHILHPEPYACYSVCGTTFKVDRAYKDLKPIGKGSYGVVCSAVNMDTGEHVAIKKVSPISTHVIDAKHMLREVRMMRYLGKHENIITLKDLFIREAEDELYIVMELLDSDLHRIIQSKQSLTEAHHRFFMHQLLKGLKFLHDHRIIHRDLKPGNLLVTRSCELRITDFGLARARPVGKGAHPDELIEEPMTEHVVTRWYRPPELMLSPDGLYDYAVDIWSVGCIFAELLGRKPLFPGKNFVQQLTLIFEVLGAPDPEEVAHVKSSQARRFLDSVATKKRVPFPTLYPDASAEAIDLLEGLLVFDPQQRLTADQALAHKYFDALRVAAPGAVPPVVTGLEFDFEQAHISKAQLKQMILKEVDSFRREVHGPCASPTLACITPTPTRHHQPPAAAATVTPSSVRSSHSSRSAAASAPPANANAYAHTTTGGHSTATSSSTTTQRRTRSGSATGRTSSSSSTGASASSSVVVPGGKRGANGGARDGGSYGSATSHTHTHQQQPYQQQVQPYTQSGQPAAVVTQQQQGVGGGATHHVPVTRGSQEGTQDESPLMSPDTSGASVIEPDADVVPDPVAPASSVSSSLPPTMRQGMAAAGLQHQGGLNDFPPAPPNLPSNFSGSTGGGAFPSSSTTLQRSWSNPPLFPPPSTGATTQPFQPLPGPTGGAHDLSSAPFGRRKKGHRTNPLGSSAMSQCEEEEMENVPLPDPNRLPHTGDSVYMHQGLGGMHGKHDASSAMDVDAYGGSEGTAVGGGDTSSTTIPPTYHHYQYYHDYTNANAEQDDVWALRPAEPVGPVVGGRHHAPSSSSSSSSSSTRSQRGAKPKQASSAAGGFLSTGLRFIGGGGGGGSQSQSGVGSVGGGGHSQGTRGMSQMRQQPHMPPPPNNNPFYHHQQHHANNPHNLQQGMSASRTSAFNPRVGSASSAHTTTHVGNPAQMMMVGSTPSAAITSGSTRPPHLTAYANFGPVMSTSTQFPPAALGGDSGGGGTTGGAVGGGGGDDVNGLPYSGPHGHGHGHIASGSSGANNTGSATTRKPQHPYASHSSSSSTTRTHSSTSTTSTASNAAAAGGATQGSTVPRSPQFSVMSWQRKGAPPAAAPGAPGANNGSTTAATTSSSSSSSRRSFSRSWR